MTFKARFMTLIQ